MQPQTTKATEGKFVSPFLNGVDMAKLDETVKSVQDDRDLGKFTFKTHNHWIDGGHSIATINSYKEADKTFTRAQSFKVEADEPPQRLGNNLGASPSEYALSALSSCMATTLAFQGAAEGKKIESIEADYEGDVDMQGFLHLDPTVRTGFKEINVNLKVKGDVSKEEVERLVKLSPVYDSLTKPVPVNVNVQIVK